jgi:glycosyltransferase involved in cell wall biosynthesis
MKHKVSIVIPTFNRKDFLARALESVLNQTYENYEIIVVDDGSTDGTKEFIQENFNDPRLNYFYKENEGLPSKTRNFGITKCSGEYIAFLDSDDYWFKDKLKEQVKILDQNVNFALVCSSAQAKKNNNDITINSYRYKKNGFVFWWLILRNFIITSSVIVRKSILDETGNFLDTKEFKIAEDLDLWLRITRHHKIAFIEEPQLFYEFDSENISSNHISNLDYVDRVVRRNLEKTQLPSIIRNKIYSITHLKKFLLSRNSKSEAISHLKSCINIDRFSIIARIFLIIYKLRSTN